MCGRGFWLFANDACSVTKETKMNKRLIGYWLATTLFCLAMTAGGMMNLMRAEMQKEAMTALGYPPIRTSG